MERIPLEEMIPLGDHRLIMGVSGREIECLYLLQEGLLAESRESLSELAPDLSEIATSLAWFPAMPGILKGTLEIFLITAVTCPLCVA